MPAHQHHKAVTTRTANMWVQYRADRKGAPPVTMICQGTLGEKAITWFKRRHGQRFKVSRTSLPPVGTARAVFLDIGETTEPANMTITADRLGPKLQDELERSSTAARIYGRYDDGISDFLEYDILFGPDD